ncbi:MAG: PepSY domain-containing protein, partial [Planctomycetota bacterium]
RDARFTRTARLEVRGDGLRQSFSYDPERASVFYSTRPFVESVETPLDRSRFKPEGVDELVPAEAWKEGAREIASALVPGNSEARDVSMRSGPTVAFTVDYEGAPYGVEYDVSRGSLSAEKLGEEGGMEARSFLLRLHLAHTYPSQGGIRWLWAILVDAMALSMVAWAISGLFMWWQIRRTRGVGLWMVGLSVGAAALIGLAMYSEFIA